MSLLKALMEVIELKSQKLNKLLFFLCNICYNKLYPRGDKMNEEIEIIGATTKAFSGLLGRYGTDITVREYVTNPAIGRDKQIKELMLILLNPEKSAILTGLPGVGKTAIVEGLAYLIQKDQVPDALKDFTILKINTMALLGTMQNGESKVQTLIDELMHEDKIILFIDEIHTLINSTDESSLDFANMFKVGLDRGDIKIIGATTTNEYERYILRDKAFVRRFMQIKVDEPSREETIKIMVGSYPRTEHRTGVKLNYSGYTIERIMTFLVDITKEYNRVYEVEGRYPDITLSLLSNAFSIAIFENRKTVTILDIYKAIENSKAIYPDVIKKALVSFKETFKDIIEEENIVI